MCVNHDTLALLEDSVLMRPLVLLMTGVLILLPTAGSPQYPVDYPSKFEQGLGADELLAIDEKSGGSPDAQPPALGHVGLDPGQEAMAVEISLEPIQIETQQPGISFQILAGEAVLILEKQIDHLPEFPLAPRRMGRFSGALGITVKGEGEVFPDQPYHSRIGLHHLIGVQVAPPAEKALYIGELQYGDRRAGRPFAR